MRSLLALEWWCFGVAALCGEGATRRKGAARDGLVERRHEARDLHKALRPLAWGVAAWDRGD